MHVCRMTLKMHSTSQGSRTVSVSKRNYFVGSSMLKVLLSDMPMEGIDAGKDIAPLLNSIFSSIYLQKVQNDVSFSGSSIFIIDSSVLKLPCSGSSVLSTWRIREQFFHRYSRGLSRCLQSLMRHLVRPIRNWKTWEASKSSTSVKNNCAARARSLSS
jgi:hypothetical protein